MPRRVTSISLLPVLLMVLMLGCSESSDREISLNPPSSSSSVNFKNVQTSLQVPSRVDFTFRLTDSQNHAVLIDPLELQSSFSILEDGADIDYSETSFFVRGAASLELDMVLLLDFTRSMVSWSDDSTNAVELMVGWVQELIDQMATGHRMAIMEYHDRNSDANVIVPFTGSQSELTQGLDDFLAVSIDNGSSRSWDALESAVDLFDADTSSSKQKLVLFITDGKETSSEITPGEVVISAKGKEVGVFIIAVGDVENQGSLESVAEQTQGELYLANDLPAFDDKLAQIKRDLGGQYRLSYITLKRTGMHKVTVQLDYQQYQGSFERSLDLGSIFGDDRIGLLTFSGPIREVSSLVLTVWAEHVPRNIDRFRFRLDTGKEVLITLPAAEDGGLCDGWFVDYSEFDNWIEIHSATPLSFGAFGSLWQMEIRDLIESEIYFEFELDTTIYDGGKTFDYPGYIVVGDPDFASYDFETGDIPPLFENSSATPWRIDASAPHGGNYAAAAGDFTVAGASTLSLQSKSGFADTISFYLRIDNQAGVASSGLFEFYLDNDLVVERHGRLSWTRIAAAVEPGNHVFAWRFVVAESDLDSNPRVWIDDIVMR